MVTRRDALAGATALLGLSGAGLGATGLAVIAAAGVGR